MKRVTETDIRVLRSRAGRTPRPKTKVGIDGTIQLTGNEFKCTKESLDILTYAGQCNDAFWDYARPLGAAGDLAFVSPAFDRLAAQLLGMATNAPADAWYVSRTVRLPGRGVLRRSRAALPPGSALGTLLAFP